MRFIIGGDKGSGTEGNCLSAAAKVFKSAGHQVLNTGVGPDFEGRVKQHGLSSDDVIVFFVNGAGTCTPASFHSAFANKVNKIWFVYPKNGNGWTTCKNLKNKKFPNCNGGEVEWSSWHKNYLAKGGVNGCSPVGDFFSSPLFSQSMGYVCGKDCAGLAQDILNNSGAGQGTQQQLTPKTTTSEMLTGEWTYQEIIEEICSGIDLLFLCKRNNVVVTDIETLYAEAQYLRDKGIAKHEDLSLWQLEQDSYDMNVDQFGFYNTVNVRYNNGVWTESYDDLVNIFGKVEITYTHKNLNQSQAQQKAKSYLAAHLRDFNMTINASVLHDGGIDIGDIITLDNPLTLKNKTKDTNEFMFVKGISVDWEGDSPITCDLELVYGPEAPDRPEIPEEGTAGYSRTSKNEKEANKWWEFAQNSVWGQDYSMNITHDPAEAYRVFKNQTGKKEWDCFACTAFLYYVLNFLCKIPTRDMVSSSSVASSGTHHCVQCKIDGEWVWPEEYNDMPNNLRVTSQMKSGKAKVFRAQPSDLNNPSSYPNHK